jgi:hypothetical protein
VAVIVHDFFFDLFATFDRLLHATAGTERIELLHI